MPRNLPNLITGARLVLAAVLFVILALVDAAKAAPAPQGALAAVRQDERLLLNVCLAIFVAAAVSDILDGQIARRWKLQTDFGRIVDPFADKVIVCGAFIQLVPIPGSQVASWMVVVILARELLVDGLRGFAEAKGVAFPAIWSGKAKMVVQSATLMWIFLALANLQGVAWAAQVTTGLLVLTLVVTLVSGGQYVLKARRVLRADVMNALSPAGQAAAGGA